MTLLNSRLEEKLEILCVCFVYIFQILNSWKKQKSKSRLQEEKVALAGAAMWLEALAPSKSFRAAASNGFVCRVLRKPLGVVLTLLIIIYEVFVPKIMNYSLVLVCTRVI